MIMKMKKVNDKIDKLVSSMMDEGATLPEIYGGICVMKRTLDTLISVNALETLDRLREERWGPAE
jgi:hypothetical protein